MTTHENREKYDQWASFYDAYPNPTVAMDELSFPELWRDMRDKAVLELGCGTGRHTLRLLEQGNHVTGLDASPNMLAEARKKCHGQTAEFIEADLVHLDRVLADEKRYDAVLSSLVFEHVDRPRPIFEQAYHRTVPGGLFFLSEIHPSRAADGKLAHFKLADGQEVVLHSVAHREGDLESAAAQAGWQLTLLRDIEGTEALAKVHSKWGRHLRQPMLRQWVWRRSS